MRSTSSGFTLVEVIAVVVILAVLALISTGFIVSASESYLQTRARANLVNTGRQAIERMTRQLRGALPHSIRISNGGNCLTFLPIAAGGRYREPVPDQANGAAATDQIETSVHEVEFGAAQFLSIGAMASDELYGSAPESLAAITDRTSTRVNFESRVWERNSLNQRFFLLDQPQAFCLFDDQLRFYPGQDITRSDVDTTAPYHLLARHAATKGTPFDLSAGSENRNINVLINIGFVEQSERVDFQQEVLIRNVP